MDRNRVHGMQIWIASLTALVCLAGIAKVGPCGAAEPLNHPVGDPTQARYGEELAPSSRGKVLLRRVWGKSARDGLLLGMWSLHLKGTGETFKKGGSNEENHLFGFRYRGFTGGTFMNSHDDRSWFVGVAREIYSRQLTSSWRFDMGYMLGPLYGYGDRLPNVGGVSLFGAGTFGFSWRRFGLDFSIIPVGVVTGGFRINFD